MGSAECESRMSGKGAPYVVEEEEGRKAGQVVNASSLSISSTQSETASKARKLAIDVRRALRRGLGKHFARIKQRLPLCPPGGRPPGRGVGGMDKSILDGYIFIEYECYVTMMTLNHLARWAGGIGGLGGERASYPTRKSFRLVRECERVRRGEAARASERR